MTDDPSHRHTMTDGSRNWSLLRVPLDLLAAAVGLIAVGHPAASVANRLLGSPVAEPTVNLAVMVAAVLGATAFGGGYLSPRDLWLAVVVLAACALALGALGRHLAPLVGVTWEGPLARAGLWVAAYAATVLVVLRPWRWSGSPAGTA